MSHDQRDSLHLKEADKSILNHLFLPYHLPSSAESDFLTQQDHQNEYEILECLRDFFRSLDAKSKLPIFSILQNCTGNWFNLQNFKNLNVSNLQTTIQQLKPGEFFSLYFHTQNAAILIEMDEDNNNEPLISSWQVSLPTEVITSSLKPHLSCFPMPTYRLDDRSQLITKAHCEVLIDFMKNTIEHTKSFKASYQFNETRDIPESHYVSQWWIMQFKGITMENNINTPNRFKKKHRDQIRWDSRILIPFRRSGLWMAIKAVLHTILIKRLKRSGTLIYKLLITRFLTYVISIRYVNASTELIVHCLRKIARRLNKVDDLLSKIQVDSDDIKEWIGNTIQEIQSKLEEILPKSDWQQSIKVQEDQLQKLFVHNLNLSNSGIYRHPFDELKRYLQMSDSHSSQYPSPGLSKHSNSAETAINQIDDIPSIEVLTNQLNYPIGKVLTRIEIWVESYLEQWIHRPSSDNGEIRFQTLLKLFENYQDKALDHYYSGGKLSDSIGYSRFILTSLTIIYCMHRELCQDERFKRLKLHSIHIPNLVKLFEYLILPNRDDMIRAYQLYDYFSQFTSKPYPNLLFRINSKNAFGVYFADLSQTMNASLQEIRDQSELDKQAKIQEVIAAKKRYQRLINKANRLECECDSYCYFMRECEKCSTESEAKNIKVSIYECPIPSKRISALAVMFELQMPIEIRCYRETIWQFINRPNPRPSHSKYAWLEVPPHKDKLTRYYTGPSNINVKLVSSTKSLTQTHYSGGLSVISTTPESFLFENSLKVEIPETETIEFEQECRILTPQLTNSNYNHLQFTIDNTQFAQNQVIAKLFACPPRMKLTQFVEFGSFRSGHCLQWWNLLSILELESLPIENESVAMLIIHSLWQYGPVKNQNSLENSWCSESHRSVLEDHFVEELISRLNHRLDDCEFNWQNELVLVVITMITMRILTICNPIREREAADLALKCRRVGEKWIELILESIQITCSSSINEIGKLRNKLATIGIACQITYSIHPARLEYVLSTNDHIVSLLKAITTVHDNIILSKTHLNMSIFMTHMLRFSQHVLTSIQPSVVELHRKLSYQSLNDFSVIYWAVIGSKGTMNGNWRKRTSDIYDGWYDGQYQSAQISIDCLQGIFLVNSMTVGFLPDKITSSTLFRRVFDDHIFEVQADESPNIYITKNSYHGERGVRYMFHADERTNQVTIYEQHDNNKKDRFQLISHECFVKELPDVFVSNYSHWKNMKSQQIEFRPVKFRDSNFLNDKPYVLTTDTGYVTTTDKEQILVNQSSLFFQNLYKRYFSRLDDAPHVYMMGDHGAHIVEKTPLLSDITIHIHLSRLGIAFKYHDNNNTITSREYSDMYIAEDQWLGTLTGLQSGLLLSPIAASDKNYEYYQCRKLIVPFGQVFAKQPTNSSHQTVTIQRASFVHQYFAFNLNDRLRIIQSTDSPSGWLYLALLHAMTSHPLPDQYTRMTGMERSFQLLKSAGCWNDQLFDELSLNILHQIAEISPKVEYYPPHLTAMEQIHWKNQTLPYSMQYVGYYLMVKKLIETSQQLNFMYPSLDSKATPKLTTINRNNEKLLGKLYWDYRDFYNPEVRLIKEMEEEILHTCSAKMYQPTLVQCSYSTTDSYIHLKDDLYASGCISLIDVPRLDYFPLSKWLGDEYQLKIVWIGLFKKASCPTTRNNQDEVEQFEILLDFLHYISVKTRSRLFYLQMLRTVLRTPAITLEPNIFPMFGNYEYIDELSVREQRIPFPWNCSTDERNGIISEIKICFEYNIVFANKGTKEYDLDTTQINRLLESWRANKNLRLFLDVVQNRICSVPTIESLRTRIPVNPQPFFFEFIADHHRIKFKRADKPINPDLIFRARQHFCHRSTENLVSSIRPIKMNRSHNEFPDQIFPSVDEHINALCDIASHFKNQLANSWKELLSVKQDEKKYPTTEEIKQLLHISRIESEQFWDELIASIKLPNKLLVETGVSLRLIPTTLISILLQNWSRERQEHNLPESDFEMFLTESQCSLLGGTIVNWISEQQLERALHFSRNGRKEDFEKEISNRPHTNWKPSDHLPWLIMELEMNLTIRAIQVDVAYHMMQSNSTAADEKVRNLVMQMNMGEGKTSVIIPMLALSLCSSSSSLVRIVVLKSLFTINYQSLRFKLGGLLNRRIFPFACRRKMNFDHTQLTRIDQRLKQGLKQCDVILTSPEYILSFDLLTLDKCRRNELDAGQLMLNMQKWLKKYARDVLDESDEILHVKYQLIYTVGGQEPIDGGSERWNIVQKILRLVKKHAENISREYSDEVYYKPCQRKSAFPSFRLLSSQPFVSLCQNIAKDWLDDKVYLAEDRKRIESFILENDSSIKSVNRPLLASDLKVFLILRGLLSSEVLFVALKKRPRVNYGVNENLDFKRLIAVPFRAKDVAAENTEFGHPDLAIVLTQLSYYYSGLNHSQMKQCLERLHQEENDPALIYHQWISYDDQDDIHSSVQQWKGVNLNDYQQRTQHLFPILQYNMLMIDYFLDHFVFPREAKQFPSKLIASPWDLSSPTRSKIITGFSGTNDTQLLLPVHIRQRDLPKLQQTDALVVNNLLQAENENYQCLSIDASSDEILEQIVHYSVLIQVILDVGALFIDGTNRQIAVKWLQSSDKSKIDYAVYFESDSIVACDRQFRHHPFLTSPASERLDRCVVYLDEIHTRGCDFKFPKGFQAALTLGHGLTKDRLVQAAMRMRQLGNGHSLVFWSSNEVDRQIQTLKEGYTKGDDPVTLLDILRWVYENTQQATWDGLHHWAAQSLNFQRKMAAFSGIQWENMEQPFSDTMIRELAEKSLEPEVMKLEQMYGASKYLETAYNIYEARYKRSKIPLATGIHNDVLKQLKKYGGTKKRLAQLLDEEQERELEQELEEERQVERPLPVTPCQPIWHEEIEKLPDTQGYMLKLARLPSVFSRLMCAFTGTTFFNNCQPNSWHQTLWISTEFQRVIQTSGESLNPFLRPPRWVVVYRKQHIIFVSPLEANWLMSHLNPVYLTDHSNDSSLTTLRLLLPRVKRSQAVLVNTPTLTIPPTIAPYNQRAAFPIPLGWLVELLIFNGTLYYENSNEQNAYCKCLGICPKPRTALEEQAFEKGFIAADGFVSESKYRRQLKGHECRFKTSPLSLVKQIIETRNNSYPSPASEVGSIIFNQLKLI